MIGGLLSRKKVIVGVLIIGACYIGYRVFFGGAKELSLTGTKFAR